MTPTLILAGTEACDTGAAALAGARCKAVYVPPAASRSSKAAAREDQIIFALMAVNTPLAIKAGGDKAEAALAENAAAERACEATSAGQVRRPLPSISAPR